MDIFDATIFHLIAEKTPAEPTNPSKSHTDSNSSDDIEGRRPSLEDIPELEDEDWDNGQFEAMDLIDHHNTRQENHQICREYSA